MYFVMLYNLFIEFISVPIHSAKSTLNLKINKKYKNYKIAWIVITIDRLYFFFMNYGLNFETKYWRSCKSVLVFIRQLFFLGCLIFYMINRIKLKLFKIDDEEKLYLIWKFIEVWFALSSKKRLSISYSKYISLNLK